MAGEVQKQTFVLLIKFGGYRQFSASKSPTSCSPKTLAVIAERYDKTSTNE